MRPTICTLFALASVVQWAPALIAQDGPNRPAGAREDHCSRARPLPACRFSMVTDFSISTWLSEREGAIPGAATIELGGVKNVSPRDGVGATFVVDAAREPISTGVALRYRRWLTGIVNADFSLGYLFRDEVTLGARLGVGGVLGIILRRDLGFDTGGWRLGAELGGTAGVVGTGIAAATVVGLVVGTAIYIASGGLDKGGISVGGCLIAC